MLRVALFALGAHCALLEEAIQRPGYSVDMMKGELDLAYEMGAVDRRLYRSALARIGQHDMSAFKAPKRARDKAGNELPEYTDPALYARVEALRADYAKVLRIPARSRAKAFAGFNQPGAVCLMTGSELKERTGSDTEILFRQESNFIYATGWDHPGARVVIGMDASSSAPLPLGEAWLFVPQRSPIWVGLEETLEKYMGKYDVYNVSWISEYNNVLNNIIRPAAVVNWDESTALQSAFNEARARKLDPEVEAIRLATEIAVEEHKTVMTHITCGMWESDAESLFRYVGHNYGARFQSYLPIVGSGPNAAALHYKDNDAIIPEDSLILIDAAAELGATRNGGGYCSDITRTWPCSGTYTPEQREVYDVVYSAQNECIQGAVIGGSFARSTELAAKSLLNGLLAIEILQHGTVDQLYNAGMHRIFQPHNLGHSVGLNVHDPGQINPFEEGTIITCEPGCYFYPSLLEPAYNDPVQGQYLNRARIQEYFINMGGVRIEDVIRVTASGPENLSSGLPRSSDEVEAFIRNARAQL